MGQRIPAPRPGTRIDTAGQAWRAGILNRDGVRFHLSDSIALGPGIPQTRRAVE